MAVSGNIIVYLNTMLFKIILPATLNLDWVTPGFLILFFGSGGINLLSLAIGILCVMVSAMIDFPFVSMAVNIAIQNAEEE